MANITYDGVSGADPGTPPVIVRVLTITNGAPSATTTVQTTGQLWPRTKSS